MANIVLQDTSGVEHVLEISPGKSLMQLITDSGIDDLLAVCGGVCSCATCHVYAEGEAAERLPPMSEDEEELLEMSEHHQSNSRLSCQITLSDQLDGLTVTVAPPE